jgi:hypothetical protein
MKNSRENLHLVIIGLKYGERTVYCSGRYKISLKPLTSFEMISGC